MTPFQWYLGYGDRPISDMLANLILNNLFGRFPRLRMLSIENGSAWVPGLLQSMDKAAKVGRRGTPIGGHVEDGRARCSGSTSGSRRTSRRTRSRSAS